jgi:hypothetical protein
MPQTTVLSVWKLEYPTLTKAQKPGGVVIATTLGANAVPNKAPYVSMPTSAPFGVDAPLVEEEVATPPVEEPTS